jgi:peptidyl-prolyl cis-trans isomerase D
MAYLNSLISPLPALELSRLSQIGVGLLPLLLIFAAVVLWILYIRSLQRALERCSAASRAIFPDAVWLLLVPVFSAVWHFFVVSRLSKSLDNESRARNEPNTGREPGKQVGMAMCILPILSVVIFVAAWIAVAQYSAPDVVVVSLQGTWLAAAIAFLVCWISYWVRIEGCSKALAKPHKAGGVASPSPNPRPNMNNLLIGIAGLSVFLALSLPSVVGFLVFEVSGRAAASADAYAAVYPHWYSRFLFSGEFVSWQRVSKIARRQLERQNPQYANNPTMLHYAEQQVGEHLVQQRILLIEAGKLGIHATKGDVDYFLHQGQSGQVLYPNGQFIGKERYAALIASQLNMSVAEFEEEVKEDIQIGRLQTLIIAAATVGDAEVRDAYRRHMTRIRFDYAVISADDLRGTINPSDGELEAYFRKNAAQYATAVPEERRIAYLGFTPGQIPGGLREPSEEEIRQYFIAHQADFTVPEQARARHILIRVAPGADPATDAAAKAKAEALLRQILGGANFADLARKYSDDPGSKMKGGELGFAKRGMMVAAFDNAIFTQKIGDVQMVKTPFGYHLVQVEERQAAQSKPLGEVERNIQARLGEQNAAAAEEKYAKDLAAEAAKNGLEKTAAAHHLQTGTTPLLDAQSANVRFPYSSEFTAKAFQSKQGDPPQFAPFGPGYAIFQVTAILPAHAPSFAGWKSHVADDYRNDQLPGLLRRKTQELADKAKAENDLAKAAKEMGATLKSSDLVGLNSQAPDLGPVGRVAPQLFDLPVGSISGPINAGRTGVVTKIVDKQEPSAEEMAKNFDQVRGHILNQHRSEVFNVFLNSVLDDYKEHDRVEVNRKAKSEAKGEETPAK